MFQGSDSLSLDAKGRLSVPVRHRDALAVASGQLVVTAHPEGCLLLYPLPAWEPIRDKILQAPSFNSRSAALTRLLMGNARNAEMDASGRLLLPPELRARAQLEKTVWLVGIGTHLEIWSEAGWAAQTAAAEAAWHGDTPPPGFEDISL